MGFNARIKRRNKCGFKGEGNHTIFKKVDCKITDFDNKFHDDTLEELVKQAKNRGFKHPGSKPFRKLLDIVRKNLYPHSHIIMNYARPRI